MNRVRRYQEAGYQVVYLRPRDDRLGLGKVLLGAAGFVGLVAALASKDGENDR